MKKIVWLIAAMIFFSVWTGCQRGRSEQEEKTYRVAAILPANNKIRATDFWQQVWNGIHDGADTFQIALSEYSQTILTELRSGLKWHCWHRATA